MRIIIHHVYLQAQSDHHCCLLIVNSPDLCCSLLTSCRLDKDHSSNVYGMRLVSVVPGNPPNNLLVEPKTVEQITRIFSDNYGMIFASFSIRTYFVGTH